MIKAYSEVHYKSCPFKNSVKVSRTSIEMHKAIMMIHTTKMSMALIR